VQSNQVSEHEERAEGKKGFWNRKIL